MTVATIKANRAKWPPEVQTRVRELHAGGLTDRGIYDRMADVFPRGPHGFRQLVEYRRRLGLTVNLRDSACRAAVIRRAVVDGFAEAARGLAARWGLPPDLTPTQVAAVLALTKGPMTAGQIKAACGSASAWPMTVDHGRRGGRKTTVIGDLASRGLVARVHVAGGKRLFLLTAACMEMLRAAAERQTAEATHAGGQ